MFLFTICTSTVHPFGMLHSHQTLQGKVSSYLRLKYDHGQHINTSLLSSSSFANPHIYSQLVSFVDLSERSTAFPSSDSSSGTSGRNGSDVSNGWLTRQGLEDQLDKYGPKVLAEEQKRKQEAVKRAQEVGKRSTIDFAPPRRDRRKDERRRDDRYRRRDRDGGWDERDTRYKR